MKTIKFLALLMCLCLSTLTIKAQDETGGSGDDTETSATDTSTAKSYTLGGGYNSSVGGTGEVALTFSAQYGEFDLCNKTSIDPAEYSGYRIVCSDPVNVQVKVVYEDDTRYPMLNDGDNSYTFETNLGNVTNIGVYCNDSGGTGSVTIKEAYLVLASTGEEEMTNSSGTNSWSYSVEATVESSATKYIFSQQYGQYALSDKEEISLSDYTGVKVNCSDVNDVQLKVVYSDNSTEKYATLKDGETTYTFETDLGNVTLVVLQANGSDGGSIILNSAYLVKAGEEETEEMTYDLTNNTQNCTYSEDATSGETSLSFSAQWGQFSLCNKSEIDITEYSGFKVTCSSPNNVQLKVSFTAGDDSYPQFDEDGVCSYTFPTDRGNVTLIAVQAKEAEASVTITSAYLVKASETEEMSNAENSNSYWYTTEPVVTTGAATYTFSQQYGQYALSDKEEISLSDYTGVKVNCSDVNDVQLKVEYTNVDPSSSTGDNYAEYKTLNEGDNSFTFTVNDDYGNVKCVAIQSKSADASIILNSAYLIKAASESSEETMVYKGVSASNPQCTASYPENSVSAVTFSALWGSVYLMEDDNTYATFTYGQGKTVYYTISFAEPTSQKLWVELDYLDDSNNFTNSNIGFNIAAGSTTYSFTISDEVLSTVAKNIDGIKIEANDEDTSIYPFTVYIASITSTESKIDALLSVNNLGSASFNATYNGSTRTITYSDTYGGCGWWFGDQDLSAYAGVEVAFKTETTDYIQLVVQYLNENSRNSSKTDTITASSATTGWGNMTDGKTLYVPFNDYAARVVQIYVQNGKTADAQIKIVGARLIEKAVEGQAYTYEMNLSGYALANWQKSTTSDESDPATTSANEGSSGTIEVDDEAGTATLTFAEDFGGLGWKNWSEAIANVGKWNLALFDRVEISYTADDSEWDTQEKYFELFTQLNDYDTGDLSNITAANTSNEKGTIILPISGGTYSDAGGETVEGDNIDWTGCGQLVILASQKDMTITVTGIKFIRDEDTSSDKDTTGKTYDLGSADASLPKTGYSSAKFYVKGDGTNGQHSITFPLNATGTYNIWLEDATINTSSSDALIAGMTIPRGVTVNLYVLGDSTALTDNQTALESKTSVIKGKTYGIRTGLNANLNIYMDRDATLNIGVTDENDNSPSAYGLYFLGTSLNADNITARGDDMYIGQINITGKWCGMYIGEDITGCDIKCINMSVTATGDSGTDVPNDMPTEYTGRSGEAAHDGITDLDEYLASDTIAHYVCAIYSKAKYLQISLSGGNFVITAEGKDTYGTFSLIESGYSFWLQCGTYVFTATKCVIHHTTDANKYCGMVGYQYESTVISFNGPFCAHYEYWNYGDGYDVWYCDGYDNYGSNASFVGGNGSTAFVIDDNNSEKFAYTFNAVQTYGEVLYVNRKLYEGWNTVCLPYRYDLSRSDDEYENSDNDELLSEYADQVEARDVISQYADFTTMQFTGDDDSGYSLTFTAWSTTGESEEGTEEVADTGDIILLPDHAYLVYVPKPGSEDNYTLDSNGAVTVKFTSKVYDSYSTNYGSTTLTNNIVKLEKVSNTSGEHDDGSQFGTAQDLVTVFAPEEMTKSSAEESNLYKISGTYVNDTIWNEDKTAWSSIEKVRTNYFNRPPAVGTAIVPDYRALFDASDQNVSTESLYIKAIDGSADDDSTTGINLVENAVITSPGDVRVYNMGGQLVKIVSSGGNVATGLTKGVYIIDGKKVVVK
ncbi:MAG: hypothetical protein LUC49_03220 [Prevotella sp.]|nr:hypothetical protein [Prevotella sp.]